MHLKGDPKASWPGWGWVVGEESHFTNVGSNLFSLQGRGMMAVGMGTIIYCCFPSNRKTVAIE